MKLIANSRYNQLKNLYDGNLAYMDEIKEAMSAYFARKVEDGMDELWDKGIWSQEKNENLLKEHLRTPYHE